MAPTPTRFALTPAGEAEANRLRPIVNARVEAQQFEKWAKARQKLLAPAEQQPAELSGNVAR